MTLEIGLAALAALALLLLAAYLMVRERSLSSWSLGITLILLALIEGADQAMLTTVSDSLSVKRWGVFLESLLPVALCFLGATYSRRESLQSLSPLWWVFIALSPLAALSTFVFPVSDFFYAPDLQAERMIFLGQVGFWFSIAMVLYPVLTLVSLEILFAATTGRDRWRMKFEFIGVGCVLAFLIFFYSQGLLYRSINLNLLEVRSGVLLLSAALIGYSRVFRGSGVRLALSRFVFYRSLTVLLVGGYLLLLGLAGEGMRHFGATFSRDLLVFLAFAGGALILMVLFSETMRRRAKVFVSKHFYSQKYDYRNEWLNFTTKLASCKTLDAAGDFVVSTYRETFFVRTAALYLFDRDHGLFRRSGGAAQEGADAGLRASPELLSYFGKGGRILNPGDGEYRPTGEEDAFVLAAGAHLVIPLNDEEGIEGLLVCGERLVQDELTYEDFDLMKNFAKQACLALRSFRLGEELAASREVAAVGRVSSFVIHDLKNLTTSLSLLVENAKEHMRDLDFQRDMIETVAATLSRMTELMQRLKNVREKRSLQRVPTDLDRLTRDTAADLLRTFRQMDVVCRGAPVFSVVDPEEIGKVLFNIMLNAAEALGGQGVIEVETGTEGAEAFVKVRDEGCGMSEDFVRNDLFKPFRTTKKKGLGIGLYQCKQIVDAHGGRIEVASSQGRGTAFAVYLPAGAGDARRTENEVPSR